MCNHEDYPCCGCGSEYSEWLYFEPPYDPDEYLYDDRGSEWVEDDE